MIPDEKDANDGKTPWPEKLKRFVALRKTPELAIFGIILGVSFGIVAKELGVADWQIKIISYPGVLFINMLKAVVLIFIVVTMSRTPMDIKEVTEVKTIGALTIVYSIVTSVLASFISLMITNGVLLLGKTQTNCSGIEEVAPPEVDVLDSFLQIGKNGFTPNIVLAMTKNNILGVLVGFLAFGFLLSKYRETDGGRTLKQVLDVTYHTVVDLISCIIALTPVGVFSLMAGEMAKLENYCVFKQLGIYIASFLASCVFHSMVVYPLIYFAAVRNNPYAYFKHFGGSITTAFATSSSAAALPIGMEAAKSLGIRESIVNFVMPLGATMNMDGSSIFYPSTIIFISSYSKTPLNAGTQVALCIVSALVTIGVAPVPSGSVVFLYLVSNAIGITLKPGLVSLIWAIDPFMDRCITAINVIGVAYGAKIIEVLADRFGPKTNENGSYSAPQKQKKIPRVVSNSLLSQVKKVERKEI